MILTIQAVVLVATVAQYASPSEWGLIVVSVLVIAAPVGVYFLRLKAQRLYSEGERLRRQLVLWDGLGKGAGADEARVLFRDEPSILGNLGPRNRESYFRSRLPFGWRRVAEIVQESAFYTGKLAQVASLLYGAVVVIGTVIAVCGAVTALRLGLGGDGEAVPAVFSALVVFFAAGTFASFYSSYARLAAESQAVYERAGFIVNRPSLCVPDAVLVMARYDCELAKAPPLPGWLHWLMRDGIDRAWRVGRKSAPGRKRRRPRK
ncbi:MAG: hypothetical protein AAB152_16570 [Candidatus Coatesbacteria bacterium]